MSVEKIHFTRDGEVAIIVHDGHTYIIYAEGIHRAYKSYGGAASWLEASGWSVCPEMS